MRDPTDPGDAAARNLSREATALLEHAREHAAGDPARTETAAMLVAALLVVAAEGRRTDAHTLPASAFMPDVAAQVATAALERAGGDVARAAEIAVAAAHMAHRSRRRPPEFPPGRGAS